MMGVRGDGMVVGSVSGGCVESAVIESALSAIESGQPCMLDFGSLTDAQVWEVGLSCGGRIKVWVDPRPTERATWDRLPDMIQRNLPITRVVRLGSGDQWLWPDNAIPIDIEPGASREVQTEGTDYFVHTTPARDQLIIIGAVHIAVPLVRFAKALDFEVIVVDPRSALTSAERFPVQPDQMISAWPSEAFAQLSLTPSTHAVVLTHDPKIDDVAVVHLLRSPVAYIGALGSRATQAKRQQFLREEGFAEADLARIHGPVGLDIGAKSPEEIAVSIIAEIIQVRNAQR